LHLQADLAHVGQISLMGELAAISCGVLLAALTCRSADLARTPSAIGDRKYRQQCQSGDGGGH
jgi:hypothetical protein